MAYNSGGFDTVNQNWNIKGFTNYIMLKNPEEPLTLLDLAWDDNAYLTMPNQIWGPKIEWEIRNNYYSYTAISTAGINDSTTTILVDSTDSINIGDYLYVDTELIGPVTAITPATPSVTAARGAGGSTAAAHVDDAVVMILPPASAENMSSYTTNSRYYSASATAAYNIAQQIHIVVEKTELMEFQEQSNNVYSSYSKNWFETEKDNMRAKMENALIYGQRQAPVVVGDAGMMGGLMYMHNLYGNADLNIAVNGDLKFENVTRSAVNIEAVRGRANTILMSPLDKDIINRGWGDHRITTRTDPVIGGDVTTFDTGFGLYKILTTNKLPAKTMYVFNSSDLKMGPVRFSGKNMGWAVVEPPIQGNVKQTVLRCMFNTMFYNLKTNFSKITWTGVVDADGI